MTTNRLGQCNVCTEEVAKYTCPGCEMKTCSLACINLHKEDTDCDGVRNKTAYKHLSKFTNMDLLSDYRLLEDISSSVDTLARNPELRHTRHKELPKHLHLLREAAHRRRMRLWFLPQNFKRHMENTTYLNWSTKIIQWRIQWLFANEEQTQKSVTDERVLENLLLSECIEKILRESKADDFINYKTNGLDNIVVLLAAENIKKARKRYFVMDMTATLRENLEGHTIVEYPVFVVVHKKYLDQYCIISLEDLKAEMQQEHNLIKSEKRKLDMPEKSTKLLKIMPDGSTNNVEVKEELDKKTIKSEFPTYSELCSS